MGLVNDAKRALLAGAVCFVLGRLSFALGAPEVTPVWPAAGFALVFVLAWGRRVLPGIALGAALADPMLQAGWRGVAIASAVALGASLQAALGAALVRRAVPMPTRLEDEREIVRFVVLGGPVACVCRAAIGVGALLLARSDADTSARAWTWWIGDVIGVLVFAPLLWILIGAGVAVRRRAIVSASLAVGFAATAGLFFAGGAVERAHASSELERGALRLESALRASFATYESVVLGVASFVTVERELGRESFRDYAKPLLDASSGLRTLVWIPMMSCDELTRHDARPLRIGERGALEPARACAPEEAILLYDVERVEPREELVGLVVSQEPERQEIMDRSRRTRRPEATNPVQIGQSERGWVMMMPVWGSDGRVRGYVGAVILVRDVIESALAGSNLALRLVDERAQVTIYGGARAKDGPPAYARTTELGGRPYRVEVFDAEPHAHQLWMVHGAGAAFVGLLSVVMLITTGRAARADALAAEQAELLSKLQRWNDDLESRVRERVRDLSAALDEKNVLLKEVHHRVKNNLQVITSLLSLQADTLPDPAAQEAFRESQARVQSIALVHERLYRSKDLVRVDFGGYLRTLVRGLLEASRREDVRWEVEAPPGGLSVNVAIPCGLIVNELVTNSIKHAFADRDGTIRVTLERDGSELELTVTDDGAGLPVGLELKRAKTLGLELVYALAEQLEAEVKVSTEGGTRFTFRFDDAAVERRSDGRQRASA